MMRFLQSVLAPARGNLRALHTPAAAAMTVLVLAMILLPRAAMAQSSSSIEVETAPNVWGLCSTSTQPGSVFAPLTSPASPTVDDSTMFRIRKNSISTESENLELQGIEFAATSSGPFASRTGSQVQFGSSPSLPRSLSSGGQQVFNISFTPPEAGIYRFIFRSQFWDGGSCTVDIPVTLSACLISQVEGIDQNGNATQNALDFGNVTLGQEVLGVLQFGFSEPFMDAGIVYSTVEEPFHIAEGFELSPDLRLATWDVSFMPTTTGDFRETVSFVALRDEDDDACFVEVLLEGRGTGEAIPEISITFGEAECGSTLEIPVTISNLSGLLLQGLDARVTTGYDLAPDPLAFSLEPTGSTSTRSFVLRYPLTGPISSGPQITVTQVVSGRSTVLLREPIPEAACIQIVEPVNLSVNFGDVTVNEAGPQRSILIANRGNIAATVTAMLGESGPAQGFGLGEGDEIADLTIAALAQETLPVTFTPPSAGAKLSSVDFTSTVTAEIPSVTLMGNGVNEAQPSLRFELSGVPVNPGGTIRFPSTALGESSSLPLVVTNDGNAPALGLALSAANGEFDVSGASPEALAPEQSASYTLTFTPQQSGTRSGQLTLSAENVETALFTLEGTGAMGPVDIDGIGLSATVTPAQTPLPTVGLELPAGAATETLEGDLVLEFVPNLSQTPNGFLAAYQAVRFMAGDGADGRTIRFQVPQGQQRATFPEEAAAGVDPLLARFQSGTVAGSIQFHLENVRTLDGDAVPVTDAMAGSAAIARLAPAIRATTTPTTPTGINVIADAVSTTREITGVCLALQAAPGTELTFTRPDPTFLNQAFTQWFVENEASFAPGGAFRVTIPIDLSNAQTFGSAQVWLRNTEGWSGPNSPCP
ncbi:MAG: choice-of-anchor D domain-containing protein [Bryobacterales bacterium]